MFSTLRVLHAAVMNYFIVSEKRKVEHSRCLVDEKDREQGQIRKKRQQKRREKEVTAGLLIRLLYIDILRIE